MRRRSPSYPWAASGPATVVSLLLALAASACSDDSRPTEPAPVGAVVAGTVSSSATGRRVAGAEVRIGSRADTTDALGQFELRGIPVGTATLRCTAPGFADFEIRIAVSADRAAHDIALARIEVFRFGDFALYVPARVDLTRGLLLALGGPDTRGFPTGDSFGAPAPEVEQALQALGADYRELAATYGLAILGTSRAAMANGVESDGQILDAIRSAATMSGHPELATAPLLIYGMSGGAPQSSGFTARNAGRVAGLFLKVPAGVEELTGGDALGVPTYVVQAELDAFVDNAKVRAAFEANRKAGALWTLAIEAGVPHHSLSPAQRQLTLNWIQTIAELRLQVIASATLRPISESSGWLGDRGTGKVWDWASYPGSRESASWLPSELTAMQWEKFYGRRPGEDAGRVDMSGIYDVELFYRIGSAATEWGVWGPEQGTRFKMVIAVEQAEDASWFTGTFTSYTVIAPGGEWSEPIVPGRVSGAIDGGGWAVIDIYVGNDLAPRWHAEGEAGSGLIKGAFADRLTGAAYGSGDFSAVRR